MKIKNKKSGFTLIEFLLYFSIAAITIFVISIFLTTLLQFRTKNQTIAEVEQEGIQVMQIVTQTARNAKAINSPTSGNSAPSISLNMADTNKNPTLFDLFSDVIRITEGANQPIPLTSSGRIIASNLTFQNLSRPGTKGTIRIQFTLTYINNSSRNEFEYSKTFLGSATIR